MDLLDALRSVANVMSQRFLSDGPNSSFELPVHLRTLINDLENLENDLIKLKCYGKTPRSNDPGLTRQPLLDSSYFLG